ncbi:MAG: hypothetical protein ACW96S_05825 [Promethearchaeota archaeon]|jgi:hypothetical protein
MKILIEKNVDIDDSVIFLILVKLHSSYLLLISDQEDMGIGNVTLGSPPMIEGIKSPTSSYNLFGVGSKLLSTIIAEKVSKKLNSPVLLLLFLKTKFQEEKIIKPLIQFITEVLEGIDKNIL